MCAEEMDRLEQWAKVCAELYVAQHVDDRKYFGEDIATAIESGHKHAFLLRHLPTGNDLHELASSAGVALRDFSRGEYREFVGYFNTYYIRSLIDHIRAVLYGEDEAHD